MKKLSKPRHLHEPLLSVWGPLLDNHCNRIYFLKGELYGGLFILGEKLCVVNFHFMMKFHPRRLFSATPALRIPITSDKVIYTKLAVRISYFLLLSLQEIGSKCHVRVEIWLKPKLATIPYICKICYLTWFFLIQGSPMANLLTWNHATVTICHSRTRDLRDVVSLLLTSWHLHKPIIFYKFSSYIVDCWFHSD